MNFYRLDHEGKAITLNRCLFDAEHGNTVLALERLHFLHCEFPNDPQVQHAEGMIRSSFLGQGIRAEECFLAAQQNTTDQLSRRANHIFNIFAAAKYSRNLAEYQRQVAIARRIAPTDPGLKLFDQIDQDLTAGATYCEIMAEAASFFHGHGQHGDCAAFAELALHAGTFRFEDELNLRRMRMLALRQVDKVAESSRRTRGEDFPSKERLVLHEALRELENVRKMEPEDHILWNYKSAWLHLLDQWEDSIAAAKNALELCPDGYVKPMTNIAIAFHKLGRIDEAREWASAALIAAEKLGNEGNADRQLAKRILADFDEKDLSDDEVLSAIAERIIGAAFLTPKQEMTHWNGAEKGEPVLKGLRKRVSTAGAAWSQVYISIMAEMLTFFSPETTYVGAAKLLDTHPEEYVHCVHAVLYLAANGNGTIQRDACRFLVVWLMGGRQPDGIRKMFRESILGPSATGLCGFDGLEQTMRDELVSYHPELIRLVADQSGLTHTELEWARNVTMARFTCGMSRDTPIVRSQKHSFTRRLKDWLGKAN